MGKHLHDKNSGIPIQNGYSGRVWRMLHGIRSRHLVHSVKKRLPHRRNHGHKNSIGDEASVSAHDNFEDRNDADIGNPGVEEKTTKSKPASKNSVRARLRARITEEISIRKRRHRRSETSPAQLVQTDAEIARGNPNNELNKEISSANSPHDLLLSNSCKKSICGQRWQAFKTKFPWDELGHNQVDECRSPVVDTDSDMEDDELLNPEEVTADSSFHHSKEVLDALDIIYLNEDFFSKVLQDQNSPFAHHMHHHQALGGKTRLSKSISLPSIEFLSVRDSEFNKPNHKQQEIDCATKEKGKLQDGSHSRLSDISKSREYSRQYSIPSGYRMDGVVKPIQAMAEIADNSLPGSANQLKNQGKSQVVIKRFKNLKEKIKHVIKQSRKERHRITMDAIFHKVPRGPGFSEESMVIADQVKDTVLNEDNGDIQACRNKNEHSVPPSRKEIVRHFRRTSSLKESLDRYCQLYECSFNRESKNHTTNTVKLRTKEADTCCKNTSKILERISSLPNIRSYYCQSKDSLGNIYGQKSVDHSMASETSSGLAVPENDETQEMFVEANSICEDSMKSASVSNYQINGSVSNCEQDDEPISKLTIQFEEPTPISLIGSNEVDTASSANVSSSEDLEQRHLPEGLNFTNHLQEAPMDIFIVPDSQGDAELREIPITVDTVHLHVDDKDKDEFNYVRDVLRVSGFSGNETLGTRYSDSQPVDPSVYEELEGCLLLDPECSRNQEGGNCNHLLLFDLINEVLMEIYQKSHTYCPMPLSSLSQIRQVPVGHHILKELWKSISWYLNSRMGLHKSLDYLVTRDLAKGDGWMDLQYDSECVGIELEDMIFDDLLDEFCWN